MSSGKAMSIERVNKLWNIGFSIGLRMKTPLLLAECVPGGTTTAHAVMTALGLEVADYVSGSAKSPPIALKKKLLLLHY